MWPSSDGASSTTLCNENIRAVPSERAHLNWTCAWGAISSHPLERWQVLCRLNTIWFGSSLHNTNISGELLSKRRDLDLSRPFSAIWILNAAHPRAAVPWWFAVGGVRACTQIGRDCVCHHCLESHNACKANYLSLNPYQPACCHQECLSVSF